MGLIFGEPRYSPNFKYFAFKTRATEYLHVERKLLEMDLGIYILKFHITSFYTKTLCKRLLCDQDDASFRTSDLKYVLVLKMLLVDNFNALH
jgi:hypothetical protein